MIDDARNELLRMAAAQGWPALNTCRGDIPAGEAAWREYAAGASILQLGTAELALRAREMDLAMPSAAGLGPRRSAGAPA